LRGIQGQRLLDQGVLARPEREQGAGVVRRMRRRDVDDVDLRVIDECVVASEGARDAEAGREVLRPLEVP